MCSSSLQVLHKSCGNPKYDAGVAPSSDDAWNRSELTAGGPDDSARDGAATETRPEWGGKGDDGAAGKRESCRGYVHTPRRGKDEPAGFVCFCRTSYCNDAGTVGTGGSQSASARSGATRLTDCLWVGTAVVVMHATNAHLISRQMIPRV